MQPTLSRAVPCGTVMGYTWVLSPLMLGGHVRILGLFWLCQGCMFWVVKADAWLLISPPSAQIRQCLCVNRREHTARVAQRFSFQGIWDLHTIAVPLSCVCPVMLPVRPCSPSPLPAASFPAPHAFSSSLLWYYPVGPDLLALHCHGWETGGLGVIWQEGLSLWCALLEREALKFQLAQTCCYKYRERALWAQSFSGHTTKKEEANRAQ